MEQDDFGDQTHPEDVGSIQSFPALKRDENGKLTPGSQAALAIAGMLPGRVADEAERLESEFQEWCPTVPESRPYDRFVPQFYLNAVQDSAVRWARKGTDILRQQVALLALNFQESQNDLKALTQRTEFYQQYVKMVEDNGKFRAFLYENFPEELKMADATNMPLIQFAQGLMLQLKSKQQ